MTHENPGGNFTPFEIPKIEARIRYQRRVSALLGMISMLTITVLSLIAVMLYRMIQTI